jgi:hypothetical protein
MPSVHETAYPRLKAAVIARDLAEVYIPTLEEMTLAAALTGSETAQACFVLLLKTFQRLGYFIYLHDVPDVIVTHIMAYLGATLPRAELDAYDRSGSRRRHVAAIRAYLQVKPYGQDAYTVLDTIIHDAAQTKEDLADLINVGIEELIRQRFELPGFSTLRRCAQRGRAAVNRAIYHQVAEALGAEGRLRLDHLLTADETTGHTLCKPRQNSLSTGGELTRPCLINISSPSHQCRTTHRMRPSLYQSQDAHIRRVTPVQHDRLHSPLTETKL